MNKILLFVILLVFSFTLMACSSAPSEPEIVKPNDIADEVELEEVIEVESREALYVYDSRPKAEKLDVVSLTLGGEPLLLPNGYVRLAGVVSGGSPLALIEVGGRGVCLKTGESLAGYYVQSIYKERVLLKNKGD